jgi:tetratricopeptide (TPR) repeat protein
VPRDCSRWMTFSFMMSRDPLTRFLLAGALMLPPALATTAAAAVAARPQEGNARPMLTAPALALPDTGVFAPVARQLRDRLARLHAMPPARVMPDRIRLLLETGQPEVANRLLARLIGSPRAVAATKAHVALVRQDFAAAAPLLEACMAQPATTGRERALLYAWLFARDASATVDSMSRAHMAGGAPDAADLLAAGRLAFESLDYARAESCFTSALAARSERDPSESAAQESAARAGLAQVLQKRRDWDGSLVQLKLALAAHVTPQVLNVLSETLIRLGRTDEAISTSEWGVRLNPCYDPAHYSLGNGYARKNYTQLVAAYPTRFADAMGRVALAKADSLLASGRRDEARAAYLRIVGAHPGWADARVRVASLDFEDARFADACTHAFTALRGCPEYGRAHAVLAKALEGQRFVVDVHRAEYERRFAAAPMPEVPGIEHFVVNWNSLSPRHQKRVALSVAPWKEFLPVLVAGGATFYIKPLYLLLSESPGQQTLRDQRISYDSRLWDDVRGCGGYHTVTGIEDVERTVFDRYNTVLHELTHQVHAMLPADDSRVIQEHYRRAKERDDATQNGYLSRYAGGSVYEYFAEGANALLSPKRDAYDSREVVRERLDSLDPDLRKLVERLMARTDVSASYPVAYAAGGDDRVSLGGVLDAIPLYQKALALRPDEETALTSYASALILANRGAEAESIAARAVAAHPTSGPARTGLADARWFAGRGLDAARAELATARPLVRPEDRWRVDAALGGYAWLAGDAAGALAACDSVIAYQSDSPEGLSGRADALALAERWDEAFTAYDQAVRMRTGIVDLRCDYARDLLRAGRTGAARVQLAEAALLEPENPTAEALRGWLELASGHTAAARRHATQALQWGPWSDLARIILGAVESKAGRAASASAAWAPVDERIRKGGPPQYVFRPNVSTWERVHALPAVERGILASFRGR